MNVNTYKLFLKIVELKNITKAGNHYNYSQSAASHMLSTMED